MTISRMTTRMLTAALTAAVIAPVAFAAHITIMRDVPILLSGVTAQGNLDDFDLAGAGEAIVVGNTRSGIYIQTARGTVTNNSTGARTFRNTGSLVFDPVSGEFQASTSDTYSISASGQARLTSVYNPAFAPQ